MLICFLFATISYTPFDVNFMQWVCCGGGLNVNLHLTEKGTKHCRGSLESRQDWLGSNLAGNYASSYDSSAWVFFKFEC